MLCSGMLLHCSRNSLLLHRSAGGNFFDYDEDVVKGVDFNDLDQVDGIMKVWKKEATKKM